MAQGTAVKAASTNSQISGAWTDPTNAYGTTGDDSWATHSQSSRNGTAEIEYGFASFTTGDIPDGSTIDSVKVSAEAHVGQSIGSIIQITIENPSNTAAGNPASTSNTSDTLIESAATTIPTLQNLRDQTVIASMLYDRANDPTTETVYIDYVSITVVYTAPAAGGDVVAPYIGGGYYP